MVKVRYNGRAYSFANTRRGKAKAKRLRKRSRNSVSAFSCGDSTTSMWG